MTNRTYLSPADTAKLIRQALKESFPRVKFAVKSTRYSGGGSINITWTDGPNAAQVEEVAQSFAGGYFDSSIDYQGSRYHTLDGAQVSFGAKYVFCNRKYSDAAIERAIRIVAAKYGQDCGATVEDYRSGKLWYRSPLENGQGNMTWSMDSLVRQALAKHTDRLKVFESATLKRVAFAGDDGYGEGTVGTGQGGNLFAKGRQEMLDRDSQREALRVATPVGGVQ